MRIARLPLDFLNTCRRLHVRLTRFLLVVRVSDQQLWLFEQRPAPPWPRSELRSAAHALSAPDFLAARAACFRLRARYRASTSRLGTGQQSGSHQTPLGLHRIAEKIGAGQPIGTVFESRQPIGLIWDGKPDGAIAHRILWLDGLEPGFNRGGVVDSYRRYIYIHGLANEPGLGRPASRGCIHLAAADLLPLFDLIPEGTLVWIGR